MTERLTSNAIIFAVNSAIKLSHNVQRAYANSLRARAMTLPLPDFNRDISETTIEFFFENESEGKRFLGQIDRLDALHEKAKTGVLDKPSGELAEYQQYYRTFYQVLHGELQDLTAGDVVALFQIRQWELGQATPRTTLQLVAGTIVDIGVDYFQHFPGALHPNSFQGRAIRHFLDAIDDIPLGEITDLKKAFTRQVVPRLFVSAVETLGDMNTSLTNDVQLQHFIQTTSQQIAQDLFRRLDQLPLPDQQDKAIQWGQILLGSLIRHGAHNFITQAPALIGVSDAEATLLQSTGSAFLSILIDEESDTLQFREALTIEGLDTVVRAAMEAIAGHPELLARQDGIKRIVAGVSQAIAVSGINRPGLAPELVRLLLEQTADHLPLLWKTTEGEGEHLLLTALRELLTQLAAPAPDGKWRPQPSRIQLLDLAALVTDEVVDNPLWITRKVGEQTLLGIVLRAVLKALEQTPADQRLRVETLPAMLRLCLRSAAGNPQILSRLHIGTDEQEATLLSQALDIVFHSVFPPEDPTGPDRPRLLSDLLEYALEVILAQHPGRRGLILLRLVVFEKAGFDFHRGFDREWADRLVNAALTVLNEYPELVTDETALQQLIAAVAATLKDTGIRRPELLPELVRLTLQHTAGNLHLLLPSPDGSFRHLLIEALKQTLAAFSRRPEERPWTPRLSSEQLLEVVEILFEEVRRHPRWIDDDPYLQLLLESILDALKGTGSKLPLPYSLFLLLLDKSLGIVQEELDFLDLSEDEEQPLLTAALRTFLETVYDPELDRRTRWQILQEEVIQVLLERFLLIIANAGATTEAVRATARRLSAALEDYANRILNTLEELLEAMEGDE